MSVMGDMLDPLLLEVHRRLTRTASDASCCYHSWSCCFCRNSLRCRITRLGASQQLHSHPAATSLNRQLPQIV
jgi:hypothetical protein